MKPRSLSSASSPKPPAGAVRHQYEPSKSKASISVSSIPKTNAAKESRPKLQRSASTTQSKAGSAVQDEGDKIGKEAERKRHRRNSSIFSSLFRRPSAPTTTATSTTSTPTSPQKPRTATAECLTCGSDDVPVSRSAKLPCGHRMCNSCLRRIFTMSIKDPQHMPPKCCGTSHIPLSSVSHLFDDKFKLTWNRRYQEYTTKNRIYCPNCSQWIKPSDTHKLKGKKYGLCPRCKTKVCTLCNNKFHSSGECPMDPETTKILDLAVQEGWQRCPGCKAMVELKEGCNHMTCRCGSQFCMICASAWKTCECPWFNYTRTTDRDRLNHMRVPQEVAAAAAAAAAAGQPQRPNEQRHHTRNESHARNDPQHGRNDRHERTPTLTYQQELDARRRQERADEALARRLQATSLPSSPTTTTRTTNSTTNLDRAPSSNTRPTSHHQRRPSSTSTSTTTTTTTTKPLISRKTSTHNPSTTTLSRRTSTSNNPSTTTLSSTHPNRPIHTRRATTSALANEILFGIPSPEHVNTSYTPVSHSRIGDLGDPMLARRGERESGRRSRRHSVAMDPGLVGDAFGTESMLGFMAPPLSSGAMERALMGGGGLGGTMQRRQSLRERLGSLKRQQDGKERIGGWLNKVG